MVERWICLNVFGSSRDLSCVYLTKEGLSQAYDGKIRRFGLDLGTTKPGHVIWKVYQLGGRVRVRVVRVNLEQAKIDFVLVEAPKPATESADPWAGDDREDTSPKKKKGKRR